MCTVVVEVPTAPSEAVRLLAVRDEDPARPWDPPGPWWRERPGVIGVRDRRAGGAWLAAYPTRGRLSVILNRPDIYSQGVPSPSNGPASRGTLVLDAVAGRPLPNPLRTAGFNLVSVDGRRVVVTSWDGEALMRQELEPGMHMIAHHDVNDPRSARIDAWLPEFQSLAGRDEHWRESWLALLERSAELPSDDDRAIIRDNRSHGYETLSLLVCTAEVRGSSEHGASLPGSGSVGLESATLAQPAVWDAPEFHRA